ncbi:hypothetical protein [Natronincola ferrireducens]|uniref:Lipoprotein n=1 Tax=Natronincola ferrireducens TaxID=393762 RepID=A0A1G8ZU36_9FIRM|nr:hypothetical protein [Natronincola ferrireducens]SDK18639.1 hypothetical protein SAMN05660472_00969 [Natronincola ferrireducens]
MTMKKRGMIFLLISIMIITMLTACSASKPPKEMLSEAILKGEEITGSQFKMILSLNINSVDIYDPEFAVFTTMLNNGKIIIEGKTDLNQEKTEATIKLDLGGMSFNANLYQYDNKLVLKIPFLAQFLGDPSLGEKYIVMDLDYLMEEFAPYQQEVQVLHEEALMALYRKIVVTSLEVLSDGAVLDKGEQTVTVGNQDVKAREIEVLIDEVELKAIIKNFFTLLQDEEFKNNVFEITATLDPYLTREEFDEQIQEAQAVAEEDVDSLFDELKENMYFENFKIQSNIFIDKTSHIIKTIVEASLGMKEGDQSFGVTMKAESESWDINKPIDIEIPNIHDENSIDFYELLFRAMYAPFF